MLLKKQDYVSPFRGMPVDIKKNTSKIISVTEAVSFYYFNSGTLTADVGQAAGTAIVGFLANSNIKNVSGKLEATKNDTSLAFTYAALTTEVAIPESLMETTDEGTPAIRLTNLVASLSNGQYVVDYTNGIIYGKKTTNTTGAGVSMTYKVNLSTQAITDASGNQIVSFGGASAAAEYASPVDFTSVYASTSTLTLAGLPFSITDATQIVFVKVITAANTSTIYLNGQSGYTFKVSGATLTAYKDGSATAIFGATDVISVGINPQKKAYDLSTDSQKITNLTPESSKYVEDNLVDTTDVAAATNYYPSATGMSLGGYKDFSLSGKMIDADGTMTLSLQATNDEDTTNADWIDISLSGIDGKTGINVIASALTLTNATLTFGVEWKNLNYSSVRVVMINDGATNTAIIKSRRKAL